MKSECNNELIYFNCKVLQNYVSEKKEIKSSNVLNNHKITGRCFITYNHKSNKVLLTIMVINNFNWVFTWEGQIFQEIIHMNISPKTIYRGTFINDIKF